MARNKGIILIENVAAVLLLGMLITAMVYSFASARMYAASARHRYQAMNIVRDKAEEIIQTGVLPDGISPSDESVTIEDPYPTQTGDELTGTLSIAYNPEPATDKVYVTISVSWTEKMWLDTARSETIVIFLNTLEA